MWLFIDDRLTGWRRRRRRRRRRRKATVRSAPDGSDKKVKTTNSEDKKQRKIRFGKAHLFTESEAEPAQVL